jgi:hypothetical protein
MKTPASLRIATAQSRERGVDQCAPRLNVVSEEARTGRRCERHSGKELRVIPAPVAPIGIRPRPVEHVFAVRMGLRVERQRTNEIPPSPCGEVTRRPAGRRRGTARRMQRGEKRMRDERCPSRDRVPGAGFDRLDRHIVAHRDGAGVGGARAAWIDRVHRKGSILRCLDVASNDRRVAVRASHAARSQRASRAKLFDADVSLPCRSPSRSSIRSSATSPGMPGRS